MANPIRAKVAAGPVLLAASAPAGPPCIIAITGYTDSTGGAAASNALPPQFHVTGTLRGFVSGTTIYGLLYTTTGTLVIDPPPNCAAGPSWSIYFDLTGLGLSSATVNYNLKVAYDSPTKDHASAEDTVTVVYP